MKKFLLLIGVCFVLGISGLALAELSSETASEEEMMIGPDGCSKSMTPVDLTLTSGDGTKTHFSIPAAYLNSKANREKRDETFIRIKALLKDMSPVCGSVEYEVKENRQHSRLFLSLVIDPSIPAAYHNVFKDYSERKYTEFVEEDEFGFRVYKTKKDVQSGKTKGFNELLIPPEGLFSKPSFIVCVRPGLSFHDGSRSRCQVMRTFSSHLWGSYYVWHEELVNIQDIDDRINELFLSFIKEQSEEGIQNDAIR